MCVSGGEAGNLVFLWLETVNKRGVALEGSTGHWSSLL